MAARRGPGGRFLSRTERAQADPDTHMSGGNDDTDTGGKSTMAEDATSTIEFVDELPKIHRAVDSGVWTERLAPLRDHQGKWAKVYGPTKNPHALVNNLRQGLAAGIDQAEYSFSGRMLPTGENDEEGNPIKEGYVFARFDTPEQRVEREQDQAERAAKRAEKAAGNGGSDEDE